MSEPRWKAWWLAALDKTEYRFQRAQMCWLPGLARTTLRPGQAHGDSLRGADVGKSDMDEFVVDVTARLITVIENGCSRNAYPRPPKQPGAAFAPERALNAAA
jgi:hypothetical protein